MWVYACAAAWRDRDQAGSYAWKSGFALYLPATWNKSINPGSKHPDFYHRKRKDSSCRKSVWTLHIFIALFRKREGYYPQRL